MKEKSWDPYRDDEASTGFLTRLFVGRPRFKPQKLGTVFPAAIAPKTSPADGAVHPDLVIDFGTSAIAAALVGGGPRPEVLLLEGKRLLDATFHRRVDLGSSVLGDNYQWLATPQKGHQLFPCLKRRIELLARTEDKGAWQHEAILDVAGLCAKVLAGARTEEITLERALAGAAFTVYITVPNAFPRAGIEVLRRGVAFGVAAVLGLEREPPVEDLLEAEAVAFGIIAKSFPASSPPLTTLLVLDAGAGTTDASIVRAHGDSLQVVAHVGLPVGGLDLDTFIMGLRGDYSQWRDEATLERRIKLAGHLRTARNTKERLLHPLGAGRARFDAASCEAMAKELITQQWPETVGGRPLAEELAQGLNRYLSLAVHGLLASLPAKELPKVDRVVVSGRGSLLPGFLEATGESLTHLLASLPKPKPPPPIETAGNDEERKLAVVQGVGTYIRSTFYSQTERQPVRSSFEVQLAHSGHGTLELVEGGQALLEGWAVESWLHSKGTRDVRFQVELRLLPRAAVAQVKDAFPGEALNELEGWAKMLLLRKIQKPPFCARFGINFLTLERFLEINGDRITIEGLDGADRGQRYGRIHPVHRLHESWYDVFKEERP